MATIDDFKYVDDDDDVDAIVVNRLLAATFGRSEYKNVETLSANRQLVNNDLPLQNFDCDGTNRSVFMPESNAVENHAFFIVNGSDGGEVITVRDYADTEDIGTIAEGDGLLLLPNGAGGYKSAGDNGTGQSTGAKIGWTSATAYFIEPGKKIVNGKRLTWASNITRTSLSLSNSTLYYVYLYDNSGTPDAEESTTAPAWNSTYLYWQKTGDATRRLVGTIRTDGSGNVYRFHCSLNGDTLEYYYESGANSSAPFEIINATGSSASWSLVDLTGLIPATAATHWWCAPKILFTNDGDDGILAVVPEDLSSITAGVASFTIRGSAGRATTRLFTGRAWINIVTSLTAYYRTQNLTGTIAASIECHGYRMQI